MESDEEVSDDCSHGCGPSAVNYINIAHVNNLHQGLSTPHTSSSTVENQTFLSPFGKFKQRLFGVKTCGLKKKLKQFYSEVTLPCVSWLDKGQDLLLSDYYVQLQLDEKSTKISIDEIFRKVNGNRPTRILIEGQPGYGKTTLATKIVYDWATNHKYLNNFQVVFFLPLRELKGRSVESALETISQHCGFVNHSITTKIIDENSSKTLLILDGFDEVLTSDRKTVLQILFKQLYSDVTVVVTCRTGLFNVEHQELSSLFGGISKKKVFYDKRVVVLGVKGESRQKFLKKFVSKKNADVVVKCLEDLTTPVNNVFSSPLFLIILSMFMVKRKELIESCTQTMLYKTFFNCVIRNSAEKSGIYIEDDFDIFDPNLSKRAQIYQSFLRKFGNMCLDKITKNDLQFECNDLTSKIYEMGFLINHKNISFFETKQHFEAFHLSILEFASAFAVKMDIEENKNDEFKKNIIEKITGIYLQSTNTSLIFPFLFGLLGKNAINLFQQLQPVSHLISLAEYNFWWLLSECQIDDDSFVSSITDFIPPQIRCPIIRFANIHHSSLLEIVIREGITSNKITRVSTDTRCNSTFPLDVEIPKFSFVVHMEENLKNYNISNLAKVQCKHLLFTLQNLHSYHNDDLVLKYINLFYTMKAKRKSLFINGCKIDEILFQNANSNLLEEIKLDHLATSLSGSNTTNSQLLCALLKRNQVKSLELLISLHSGEFSISDFMEIIKIMSNSKYLDSLHLIVMPPKLYEIDLYHLTNGGQKCWNTLILKFFTVTCTNALSKQNCIKNLLTKNDDSRSSDILQTLEIQVLECDAKIISNIQNAVNSSWPSCNSLVELILLLDTTAESSDFWLKLSHFKHLQTFEIITPHRGEVCVPVESVVQCLQSLPITRLVLWRACRTFMSAFTRDLVERISSTLPWKYKRCSHPFSIMDISFSDFSDQSVENDLSFTVVESLECLKLRRLQKVNIICNRVSLWYFLNEKNYIDNHVFNVKHRLLGSNESDPIYYKLWCDQFSTYGNHEFSISLK